MAQGYTGGNVTPPGTGQVVQVVNTSDGAVATGTTAIPYDNTIPQITEGDQYMTRSITPTSASNKLLIQVVFYGTASSNDRMIVALFQDSTANALAVGQSTFATAGYIFPVVINYYMTAGTTSSTTFKVRAGATSGTTTFNGSGGSGYFGGVYASSITITEIKA